MTGDVPPFTYETPHRFGGMRRTEDGKWYGTCACGHAEVPAADKDTAWEEIASHAMNAPRGLRDALAELRRDRAQYN